MRISAVLGGLALGLMSGGTYASHSRGSPVREGIGKFIAAASIVAAFSFVSAADAATFHLDYQGAATIDATLTAADLGGDQWLVTDLSGTVTDGGAPEAMTLVSDGPSVFGIPGFIVDNVLYYPAGPGSSFDPYGLAFAASGMDWNLWGNGTGQAYTLYAYNGGGYPVMDFGSATVTAVPESSTWVLMCAGFIGLAFAGRRGCRPAVAIA